MEELSSFNRLSFRVFRSNPYLITCTVIASEAKQSFIILFYLLSLGKYAMLSGILDIAFDGHVRAIEHSLQFTHRSCLICI